MADYARAQRAIIDLGEALSTMEIEYPGPDELTLHTMFRDVLLRIDATVIHHQALAERKAMLARPPKAIVNGDGTFTFEGDSTPWP